MAKRKPRCSNRRLIGEAHLALAHISANDNSLSATQPTPIRTSRSQADRRTLFNDNNAIRPKKPKRKGTRKRTRCLLGDKQESALPARPARPTLTLPGTPERLAILEARAANRQTLFTPGDLVNSETLFFLKDEAPNEDVELTNPAPLLSAAIEESVNNNRFGETQSLPSWGASGKEERRAFRNRNRLGKGCKNLIIDERNEDEKRVKKNLAKLYGASPATRIRAAREALGMTVCEASVAMGLSYAMLAKIECGDLPPTLWVIYHAAEFFRLLPDHLACIEADESGTIRCLCG